MRCICIGRTSSVLASKPVCIFFQNERWAKKGQRLSSTCSKYFMTYCISCSDASYSVLRDTVSEVCVSDVFVCGKPFAHLTHVIFFPSWVIMVKVCSTTAILKCPAKTPSVFFGMCDRGRYHFIFSHWFSWPLFQLLQKSKQNRHNEI